MRQYKRVEQLETELNKRLDTKEIDVSLIVESVKVIQALGENPNDIFRRLIKRCKDKQS